MPNSITLTSSPQIILVQLPRSKTFQDGEGNGNPLQCSCLENLRDGGAWWAAVYGVAESRTGLKRLSSSNMYICMFMYIYFYVRYMVDRLQAEHLQSARLLFGFPSGPDGIVSALSGGDLGVIHGLGRSPGGTGMTTHSSILAWRIPLDRGAWRPQFLRSQSVQHD